MSAGYISIGEIEPPLNYFFSAQFNYYSLIHSGNNYVTKYLHERCLLLIYLEKNLSYEESLSKDGSVSICHKNIQTMATEMYKAKIELP